MFCQVQRNIYLEAAARGALRKKVFLKISQNSHENTRAPFNNVSLFFKYQGLFFNNVAGLKKETLAQAFSCEFCQISKNTFL